MPLETTLWQLKECKEYLSFKKTSKTDISFSLKLYGLDNTCRGNQNRWQSSAQACYMTRGLIEHSLCRTITEILNWPRYSIGEEVLIYSENNKDDYYSNTNKRIIKIKGGNGFFPSDILYFLPTYDQHDI